MIRKQSTTAEDLLDMPGDGNSYELVRGELRMMTRGGFEHGRLAMKLGSRIEQHVAQHGLGVVLAAETGFTLERNPDTVRAPDVAFVRQDRVPASDERHKFAELAPDLAVEVISPNDKPADIEEKMSDYRVAGVRLVWVVYPDKKCVVEHRPDTPPRTLGLGDVHEGHDVLPGFTCRLKDLLT